MLLQPALYRGDCNPPSVCWLWKRKDGDGGGHKRETWALPSTQHGLGQQSLWPPTGLHALSHGLVDAWLIYSDRLRHPRNPRLSALFMFFVRWLW